MAQGFDGRHRDTQALSWGIRDTLCSEHTPLLVRPSRSGRAANLIFRRSMHSSIDAMRQVIDFPPLLCRRVEGGVSRTCCRNRSVEASGTPTPSDYAATLGYRGFGALSIRGRLPLNAPVLAGEVSAGLWGFVGEISSDSLHSQAPYDRACQWIFRRGPASRLKQSAVRQVTQQGTSAVAPIPMRPSEPSQGGRSTVEPSATSEPRKVSADCGPARAPGVPPTSRCDPDMHSNRPLWTLPNEPRRLSQREGRRF